MQDPATILSSHLAERLGLAMDREAKIAAALEALGPIGGRDILLLDGAIVTIADRLTRAGARVTPITADVLAGSDGSGPEYQADVLVVAWSAFRGPRPEELAAARRLLRPGGRLLVIHDYGRDDVSRLYGQRPEYGEWSRRDGPFLGGGFKVRVIHSWWAFDSLEEMRAFLTEAFGEAGTRVGAELTRPRLSYNVAVYHRSFEPG